MAASNTADMSIDDGIPLDFLAEMHVAMDCLPVDEAEANRIIAEKLRKEQLERNAERVRQFNNAWNIQPIDCDETTSRRAVPHSSSSANGPIEKIPVRDPRIVARSTQSLLEGNANHRSPYVGIVPMPPAAEQQLDALIHERALARLRASNTYDNGDVVFLDEEQIEPHRTEHSRVPNQQPLASGQHSRGAGRTRSRGRRSRRHSRSASKSPSHRRRRKHARSRSRHRSPSYSRSRSSSCSSEHSHGTVDSRGRSSRKNNNMDTATMLQSVMAMTMQMFSQAGTFLNGQGGNPKALSNHVPYPAADSLPGTMMDDALRFAPSAFRNMFANQTAGAQATQPEENRANTGNDMSTIVVEDNDDRPNQPKYDVSTELFLEGKLSFTDFLSMKPSARSDQIAPVDPKVPKRINEAITILEQQDAKKQSARFLYIPPTFYGSDTSSKREHERSPLIWNNQNVLFPFTSHAKEAKLCQPFRNVNAKLKELTEKLGLDEGIVSQQLEKTMQRAATAVEQNSNNRSATDALSSSSRIQAITTVSPKPGSGKVRHLIDRIVQTDGYACMQCVARNNKTFITTSTQTIPPAMRKDSEVQTSGPPLSGPNVISLDGMNTTQIETIDAIVRFIRTRQLAGSIESVQHALRNDRATAAGMTPAIQHNAQRLLSQVKIDLQRSEPYAGTSQAHYGNMQLQQSSSHLPQFQYESPRDPRFRHPGSGITRTFRTTTTTMAEQIIPAGYESQPALSRKMKKKMKRW
ncbi:uncharacterized protein LOC128310857 [Anopheles moucheti]|uniref:uncharacterized protein LOC128310857 n=1 Tax=Anopheles moucheti TaxID=186751 RepID=UPI0022F07966|nr:uncharacterized protein LOC128310857 [Anopheles moucheti]